MKYTYVIIALVLLTITPAYNYSMEYTEVPYTQKTKERMKNFGIFGFITGTISFACLDEPPQPTYVIKYPNNIFKKDKPPYQTLINPHPYTLLRKSAIAGIFTGLAFAYCAYRISPERKLRKLDTVNRETQRKCYNIIGQDVRYMNDEAIERFVKSTNPKLLESQIDKLNYLNHKLCEQWNKTYELRDFFWRYSAENPNPWYDRLKKSPILTDTRHTIADICNIVSKLKK